jgi:hypothetical protein
MVATDFFTAEVWLAQVLIHDCVSFVIGLTTREVKIAGIVSEPNDDRMHFILSIVAILFAVLPRFQVRQAKSDFSIGLKGDQHDN